MTPTPTLQDLIDTVRASVPDEDPSAQLAKAAEVAGGLSQLGDRLLDHFVFQCRQAGMSWAELSASLGVSKQAAHKRFTGVAPTLQRYTVKAQQAVQNSIEQARALGHAAVGTEHLLLALFEPADSLAALTLARLQVRREQVSDQVIAAQPSAGEQTEGAIPFTAKTKAAMRAALDEALDLNHNYIGTEHLLLALQRDESAESARILAALGADRDAVRATLLAELDRIVQARKALAVATE
jgi:ATP-dependent Clp protease ATP-binding subunit ClpA